MDCEYTNQPVVKIEVKSDSGSASPDSKSKKRKRDEIPRHHDGLAASSSSSEDERRFISRRAERLRRSLARIDSEANDPVVVLYETLSDEQKAQLERWRALLRMKPSIKSMQLSHTPTTINFLVDTMGTYPQVFKATGKTPFIHPSLAGTNQCKASDAIFHTCFGKAGPALHHHVRTLLDSGAEQGSLEGLLTAVQALLLGLMALIFGGTRLPDRESKRLLHSLAKWTQVLYERLPQRLPPDLKPWEAWVFGESVRRTILISHLLLATYMMKTTGSFLLNTFYTSLPFDGRTGLWENMLDPEDASLGSEGIMSYKEFTEAYKAGNRQLPGDSSSFETLVTVACAGYEAVSAKGDVPAATNCTA